MTDVQGKPDPDNGELTTAVLRLTATAAVIAYVVVFLVAQQMGSSAEEALLKGGAAMLAIGLLGWVTLSIVGHGGDDGEVPSGGPASGGSLAFAAPQQPRGDEKR